MQKLEISFDGRTPYGDDDTLSRKVNVEFEVDADLGGVRLINEFNKFLFMLGFEERVKIDG